MRIRQKIPIWNWFALEGRVPSGDTSGASDALMVVPASLRGEIRDCLGPCGQGCGPAPARRPWGAARGQIQVLLASVPESFHAGSAMWPVRIRRFP